MTITTQTHTHQTAPTQTVDANDISFAFRRLGTITAGVPPLVLVQHFTGNLDNWDPKIVDGFAVDREVILFDNAGVASSTGTTPDTVAQMAADAISFLDALGLTEVDLLGFSLGGLVSQEIVLARPDLVRRLVLVGTGPAGGEGMAAFTPEVAHMFFREREVPDEVWLEGFFTTSEKSQTAARAFLDRIRLRRHDRDDPTDGATAQAQLAAVGAYGTPPEAGRYAHLKQIAQPTLVINGHTDIIIPTINSFILQQELPDAQLIVYPDSNHGAQYAYPELFLEHVTTFLEAPGDDVAPS